jgi:hypothetical protein
MEFWKDLCLSGIGGLTWLSFNYPRFARKILYTLSTCCILIRVGLRIYQCGYQDCLDGRTTAILQNSFSQMNFAIEKYSFYLDIAGAILLVLIFFCIHVELDKQLRGKKIPAATDRDS